MKVLQANFENIFIHSSRIDIKSIYACVLF